MYFIKDRPSLQIYTVSYPQNVPQDYSNGHFDHSDSSRHTIRRTSSFNVVELVQIRRGELEKSFHAENEKKKRKRRERRCIETMETASESGRAPDQREGGAAAHPRRRVGHKNRKSADRRSPITENTAAVCGHTMRTMPSRCWIAITPVEGKPNQGDGGGAGRDIF